MPCLYGGGEHPQGCVRQWTLRGKGGLYVAAEQLERRVHTAVDGMDELILLRDISVDCLMDADRAGELILQS